MKALHRYIKPSMLLAVVLCATVVNIFTSVSITHAAPTDPASVYIAPEVLADATASEYRTSLALCLTNNGGGDMTGGVGDTMSPQDAANGKWFTGGGNFEVRPGILVWGNADNGLGCNDLFKYPVAQSLGIADNITLACSVGLVRTDGKSCLNDPAQSDFTDSNINGNASKVYAALDAVRKNNSAPPTGGWNDAQRYANVMQTFTSYCQATPVVNTNSTNATPVIKAKYANNIIDVVDGTGTLTQVYYNIPDTGKKVMLWNDQNDFHWTEVNCGTQIRDAIHQYSAAYATYVKAHPQSTTSQGGGGGTGGSGGSNTTTTPDKTACSINGIGWIVCPVMRFMAQVTDYAYGIVSDMLTTPALSTDTTSPMYQAWSVMRNFANVIFVIGFLVIIYSQITNVGIGNYGIKKMLPRIIMAAILVNLSYWICAIAIDVSNILGSSLEGLLEGIAKEPQLFQAGKSFITSGGGGGWDTLTVGIITGATAGAVLYAGLSVLLPMLIAALVAIITVVVVLTARQALITVLTVLSPLAFAALLLPNSKIPKRFEETYVNLLGLFPVIALIFGGSKLASVVVMNSPGANTLTQIMAAGITIVPLIATPVVLKSAKGFLGKVGAYVNNPNRGPIDRMRKGAEGYRKNRQEYRKLKDLNPKKYSLPGRAAVTRKRAQRQAVLNNRQAELNVATSSYISGLARDNPKFRNRLAQGGTEGAEGRALAHALNIQAKLKADEVTAATAVIKNANLEGDIKSLQKLAMGESVKYTTTTPDGKTVTQTLSAPAGSALQTAAIQQQFKIGDVPSTDQLVMESGSMGVDQRQAIADGMRSMSSKVKYYGGSAGNTVAQGNVKGVDDLNKLVADAVDGGKIGTNDLVEGDHDALARIADVMANPGSTTSKGTLIDSDKKKAVQKAVTEIKTNPNIKKPADRVMARLDKIEAGKQYDGSAFIQPPRPTSD